VGEELEEEAGLKKSSDLQKIGFSLCFVKLEIERIQELANSIKIKFALLVQIGLPPSLLQEGLDMVISSLLHEILDGKDPIISLFFGVANNVEGFKGSAIDY